MPTPEPTKPEPEPGRLASLGDAVDREDAKDLLDVIRAMARHQSRGRLGQVKAAREALWWMWEQRRLPRPLVRGKYPASYPWSPGATRALQNVRDAGLADGRLSGVIIEHLIPARITMSAALERAPELDVEAMLKLLRGHGAAAVITSEEDKQFIAAGVAAVMPPGWDGVDEWARARAAGFQPSSFSPVGASVGVLDRAGHIAAGHDEEKIDMAWQLVEQISAAKDWPFSISKNQITFRDGEAIVLRVQFWGNTVRLESGVPIRVSPNPFAPVAVQVGTSGLPYWTFATASELPTVVEPLVRLISMDQRPEEGTTPMSEYEDESVARQPTEQPSDGRGDRPSSTGTNRTDFGVDVDAAIRQWGKYEGFAEGFDLVHRVLNVLQPTIGSVDHCFTPPSNQYVAVRLAGLDPTAMTVEPGRLYVTPPAVAAFVEQGKEARAELSAAGIVSEAHEREGLSVWNSRGVRDRSTSASPKPPAGLLCANPSCGGAFVRQPSGDCSYCGEQLSES